MGIYRNQKRVMKFIVDKKIMLEPNILAGMIAEQSKKLTMAEAQEAIDQAVESDFLKAPKKEGEYFTITPLGKRHAKQRFSMYDEAIGSFKSFSVVVSVVAIVISVIALFRSK